jgi:hypothetical protein
MAGYIHQYVASLEAGITAPPSIEPLYLDQDGAVLSFTPHASTWALRRRAWDAGACCFYLLPTTESSATALALSHLYPDLLEPLSRALGESLDLETAQDVLASCFLVIGVKTLRFRRIHVFLARDAREDLRQRPQVVGVLLEALAQVRRKVVVNPVPHNSRMRLGTWRVVQDSRMHAAMVHMLRMRRGLQAPMTGFDHGAACLGEASAAEVGTALRGPLQAGQQPVRTSFWVYGNAACYLGMFCRWLLRGRWRSGVLLVTDRPKFYETGVQAAGVAKVATFKSPRSLMQACGTLATSQWKRRVWCVAPETLSAAASAAGFFDFLCAMTHIIVDLPPGTKSLKPWVTAWRVVIRVPRNINMVVVQSSSTPLLPPERQLTATFHKGGTPKQPGYAWRTIVRPCRAHLIVTQGSPAATRPWPLFHHDAAATVCAEPEEATIEEFPLRRVLAGSKSMLGKQATFKRLYGMSSWADMQRGPRQLADGLQAVSQAWFADDRRCCNASFLAALQDVMPESAWTTLSQDLAGAQDTAGPTCALCFSECSVVIYLACGHGVCRECWDAAAADGRHKPWLKCPSCRETPAAAVPAQAGFWHVVPLDVEPAGPQACRARQALRDAFLMPQERWIMQWLRSAWSRLFAPRRVLLVVDAGWMRAVNTAARGSGCTITRLATRQDAFALLQAFKNGQGDILAVVAMHEVSMFLTASLHAFRKQPHAAGIGDLPWDAVFLLPDQQTRAPKQAGSPHHVQQEPSMAFWAAATSGGLHGLFAGLTPRTHLIVHAAPQQEALFLEASNIQHSASHPTGKDHCLVFAVAAQNPGGHEQ